MRANIERKLLISGNVDMYIDRRVHAKQYIMFSQ